MGKALNLVTNLLFPPHCANCGELLDVELLKKVNDPFCPSCRIHYENEKQRECGSCGLSMRFCSCMPHNMQRAQCTGLLKLISYRPHDTEMPIKSFVYSIKHSNYRVTFDFVAEQMRDLLIAEMRAKELMPSDCVITFVPRSRKNKAEDGFDQGYLLAKALSRQTGIRLVACFKRNRFSGEQKKLNQYERRLNMRSAYTPRAVEEKIADKTVILVDDIVTTGASMAACARLLGAMGAYAVMGICFGYTEKEKNKNKSKNKRIND